MRWGLLGVVFVMAMLVAAPARADQLPVDWSVASVLSGGGTPDQVAGANDWSCKPSARHPRPVVLVHGFLANLGDNWHTMAPLLKNNGFCVFGLTYGRDPGEDTFGGMLPMEQSAAQLDAFVDRVLKTTGTDKVDLVGHSEGTMMPRWWMTFLDGAKKVDHYVMLTPLWDGTNVAGIGTVSDLARRLNANQDDVNAQTFAGLGCGACPEFANDSPWLKKVNGAGRALPGVTYTNIVTRYDELVSPYTSGILESPGVTNVTLQDVCPTDYSEHLAVAYDPMAAQLMLNALDPAHARPVPCTLMTPAGAPNPPEVGLAGSADGGSASHASSPACTRGRAVNLTLPRRRGERIRSVTATVGKRVVATRKGSSLRALRLAGLAPGKYTVKLRLHTTRGVRTATVRQTVACA
jgi:triacylglycerol lipase